MEKLAESCKFAQKPVTKKLVQKHKSITAVHTHTHMISGHFFGILVEMCPIQWVVYKLFLVHFGTCWYLFGTFFVVFLVLFGTFWSCLVFSVHYSNLCYFFVLYCTFGLGWVGYCLVLSGTFWFFLVLYCSLW